MEPVIAMDMEEMKNVDIRTVDRESLADINDVHINRKLPREGDTVPVWNRTALIWLRSKGLQKNMLLIPC